MFHEPSAGVLAPNHGHKGAVEVGIESDIGGSIRARKGELGDEGEVRENLSVGGRVGRCLHLRVLAFLAFKRIECNL